MVHPGSNLLRRASRLIKPTTGVNYMRNTGRVANAAGQYETSFAAPQPISGSHVMAMSLSAINQNGLDVMRRYVTWYVSGKVVGVERDYSGDRISWNGSTWELIAGSDWTEQDGWMKIVAIRIVE